MKFLTILYQVWYMSEYSVQTVEVIENANPSTVRGLVNHEFARADIAVIDTIFPERIMTWCRMRR
jgi:UDP-glucose 6-dehydrogenase